MGEEGAADRDLQEQGSPMGLNGQNDLSGMPNRLLGRAHQAWPLALRVAHAGQESSAQPWRRRWYPLSGLEKYPEGRNALPYTSYMWPSFLPSPKSSNHPPRNQTHPSRTFCPQTTFLFSLSHPENVPLPQTCLTQQSVRKNQRDPFLIHTQE